MPNDLTWPVERLIWTGWLFELPGKELNSISQARVAIELKSFDHVLTKANQWKIFDVPSVDVHNRKRAIRNWNDEGVFDTDSLNVLLDRQNQQESNRNSLTVPILPGVIDAWDECNMRDSSVALVDLNEFGRGEESDGEEGVNAIAVGHPEE